jgi:hypothetical protein
LTDFLHAFSSKLCAQFNSGVAKKARLGPDRLPAIQQKAIGLSAERKKRKSANPMAFFLAQGAPIATYTTPHGGNCEDSVRMYFMQARFSYHCATRFET